MNCRKINSLLSAYMDGELAEGEMEAVREHLNHCSACRLEHETLMQTKRAVASLAYRVSREEIARLLRENESVSQPARLANWKISPVAATLVLSLAGLWLATTSLDSPRDWHQPTAYPDTIPVATTEPATMSLMLATLSPNASMTTVSNPVTIYTVTSGRTVLSRTTFRQAHFGIGIPKPPSVRRVIGRLLGWSAPRPASVVSTPSLTMVGYGYDNTPVSSGMPVIRMVNERDESTPDSESLWQESAPTQRYTTALFTN